MRLVIQRVKNASVTVEGKIVGKIGTGLMILVGVRAGDTEDEVGYCVDKSLSLRIFDDEQGKMNRSLIDCNGSVLIVSQFTLYGETRKGNRPSYSEAAPPELAERLYEAFVDRVKQRIGNDRVATGVFKAMMDVHLVNDGPVTLILESKQRFI